MGLEPGRKDGLAVEVERVLRGKWIPFSSHVLSLVWFTVDEHIVHRYVKRSGNSESDFE